MSLVPKAATLNYGEIYSGVCKPVNKKFAVNGAVYYLNASMHYCWYPSSGYLSAFGGGDSGIITLDAMPPDTTSDGACGPINQNFNAGGTVFHADSNKHVCSYQNPSYLNAFGGNDAGPAVEGFPAGYNLDGACGPVNQTFNVGGVVYFEGDQKHMCAFQDPAYLAAFGGNNAGPNVDSLPSGYQLDENCGPSDQNFNTGGTVYHANNAKHVCSFANPDNLMRLGGNDPGPYLDAFPSGFQIDGNCH